MIHLSLFVTVTKRTRSKMICGSKRTRSGMSHNRISCIGSEEEMTLIKRQHRCKTGAAHSTVNPFCGQARKLPVQTMKYSFGEEKK